MKTIPALLFALLITGVVGVSMIVIGANALFNRNTVATLSSPGVTTVSAASLPADQQTIEQMQQLISQYQQREKEYQDRLSQAAQTIDTANQQLNQANQTIQSYGQVLEALQERGLIQINNDGQIMIPRGRFDN